MNSNNTLIKTAILLTLLTLISEVVNAQSFDNFRWKHRILVVCTESLTGKDYQEQIEALRSDPDGLLERRLLIFSLTPESYAEGLHPTRWKAAKTRAAAIKKEQAFEVILIGLDGGVKKRQEQPISLKELYGLIDAMPMRANELKNKRGN